MKRRLLVLVECGWKGAMEGGGTVEEVNNVQMIT